MKIILFILTLTAILIWVPSASAFIPCDPGETPVTLPDGKPSCGPGSGGGSGGGGTNVAPKLPDSPADKLGQGPDLIGQLVTQVLPIAIGLGGFLAIVFIIVSGVQFITSSGNPEAANAARNRLMYALVGFTILALSFLIVQLINRLFLGSTDIPQ